MTELLLSGDGEARKGLLTRRREGRTDIYRAALSRETYAEARARHEIETLVSRYGDVALAHFAREVDRLAPEHRRQLRELVLRRTTSETGLYDPPPARTVCAR